MRILLIAAAVLGLSTSAVFAEEPRPYDARLLPHDEAGLSALDHKQLRIVRRTTAQCNATEPFLVRARAAQRPCIIGGVDHAVDTSGDAALQAYHAALPFNVRYDRFRSSYYYQQMLVQYRR
jgi:hypothetical protein